MDFDYTDEQKLLRDMVRRFGEGSVSPASREMDEREKIPGALIQEMAGLGLLGLAVPEAFGGSGVSLLTQAIVAEELGRVSAALAVTAVHHAFLLPALLLECGSEAQKSRWLPGLSSGEAIGTVAVGPVRLLAPPEGPREAGSAAGEVTARREGRGKGLFRLEGRADWVVNGGSAGVCALFARTRGGAEAFLVARGEVDFSAEPVTGKLGLRPADFARWTFSGSRVEESARLDCGYSPKGAAGGEPGGGEALRRGLRLLTDLFLAAVGVGLVQACVEVSAGYAKARKQFGRPIGSFQLVQDLIARMVFDGEAARLLVYRAAAGAQGRGLRLGDAQAAIARARSLAAEAALRAGTDAVQVHGGYGFSAEYPAERLFRDARALALLSGGTAELLGASAEPVLREALARRGA